MRLLQKKQQSPLRRSIPSHVGRASHAELDQRYAFRRNRTLTGSLSSSVLSVNEHRAELKSARVHSHHLREHRRRLLWLLIGVIGVITGIGWVLFQSIAHVAISAQGAIIADTQPYIQKITQYLDTHPIERTRATLETDSLTSYLQQNGFPEIKQINPTIQPDGIGGAHMTLTMRQPVLTWKTGQTQLFVDNEGVAFTRNYFAPPAVEVIDQTGIAAQGNQVLASNRFLAFMGQTIGYFREENYTVTKIVLPPNTSRQILVSLDTATYPVKLSVDRPAGEQAEDAARAIHYLASKGIAPAEYLDVRVSGKAYYR